jgi:pimeloyl-ACP methyl ester carboxylesterase
VGILCERLGLLREQSFHFYLERSRANAASLYGPESEISCLRALHVRLPLEEIKSDEPRTPSGLSNSERLNELMIQRDGAKRSHFAFAKNRSNSIVGFMLPKTKYARSDDVRIAYQVSGDGPFDVVWAPGTMSHLDLDWEIPQRANIFGVSEGGSMACLFAATYPHRVNSLLVWGAQARWIACDDHPWGQSQEEHNRMVAMIQDDWPTFEYVTGPGAGVGKDANPAFIESLSRYMRAAASPSAVLAYETMNGQMDTRPILPSIQAPTLVMNRTGDPCANVEAARDMASRIPGAKFKEYPGNSHSMMLDDMETILSDIQEFITGERPIDSSDRVLATVLFIDIASSTERAAALGDTAWGNLLNSYYAIVRKELARFRGKETNTTGDGFLATFDGPHERFAPPLPLCGRSSNWALRRAQAFTPANAN